MNCLFNAKITIPLPFFVRDEIHAGGIHPGVVMFRLNFAFKKILII